MNIFFYPLSIIIRMPFYNTPFDETTKEREKDKKTDETTEEREKDKKNTGICLNFFFLLSRSFKPLINSVE